MLQLAVAGTQEIIANIVIFSWQVPTMWHRVYLAENMNETGTGKIVPGGFRLEK